MMPMYFSLTIHSLVLFTLYQKIHQTKNCNRYKNRWDVIMTGNIFRIDQVFVRFFFFSFRFFHWMSFSVVHSLNVHLCTKCHKSKSASVWTAFFSCSALSLSFFMRKVKNQIKPHSSWKFFNVWNWNGLSDIEIESHCDEYIQSTKFETEMKSIKKKADDHYIYGCKIKIFTR